MRNEMDELLKQVLTPREEAGDILNRKILNQVKETGNMRQKKYKRASVAVIAAALAASASITAVAAWQYKSPADVAQRIGDEGLAGHFAGQTADAGEAVWPGSAGNLMGNFIKNPMGESQSGGGYKVTVLGLLFGEGLSDFQHISNGEVKSDRTYCVVAIQREDGAAVDAEHNSFFVSPLIEGLNPGLYNIGSMSGSYTEFVEEGILYRLVACDDIAYFADRRLYLCVTDTGFYDSTLYHYNESDGSISRNTEYQGLNALFDLELDGSLADPAKAQALIDEIDSPDADGGTIELPRETEGAMEWAGRLTPENIGQYCVRMEDTVQTMAVDEDGYYTLKPWLVNKEVSDSRGGGGGKILEGGRTPGMWIDGYSAGGGSMEDLVITTYTLNEDGTLTFAAWVPRDVSKYLK